MKHTAIPSAMLIAGFAAGGMSPAFAADNTQNQAATDNQQNNKTAANTPGRQTQGQSASKNAPIVVLVPFVVAANPDFGNGCWANLYDSTDFQGNQLQLVGPVDMPNMRTAFGTDWSGQFDSIKVGPKATLTVYDNENYRQKAATFKPGQDVKDLDEKMGMFEQIRSVKISCGPGGETAQQ